MSTNSNVSTNVNLGGNFLTSQQTQLQNLQNPSISHQIAQPQSSSTPNNILPLAVKPTHHSIAVSSTQKPIPPRYHQPPQPGGAAKPQLINNTKFYVPNGYPTKHPNNVPSLYFSDPTKPEISLRHNQQRLNQVSLGQSSSNTHQYHQPPPPPPQLVHRITPSGDNLFESQIIANRLQQSTQSGSEMLKFVRKADSDTSTTASSNSGRLSVEQPTKQYVQTLSNEITMLKEANQRLSDDNQELRDLCCFLDDDRQKGRKLAREWQRFGRYTASVMRQEVSSYQNKLRQLDDKQQELIRDNLELKELCLYLDEERSNQCRNIVCPHCGTNINTVPLRDDGDGSSSSTNVDENVSSHSQYSRALQESKGLILTDQTLHYVRSLEKRIQELEEQQGKINPLDHISSRPEAVVRALQVLEVREQLEREKLTATDTIPDLDDKEKALVREMCNVVWRKLEEAPENGLNRL